MKTFMKQVVVGIMIWVFYSFEVLIILLFFDRLLNLTWVNITMDGDPFFNGIFWFILFITWTLLTGVLTKVMVAEPSE